MTTLPTREQDRIVTLDVLRGFAVLGILLLNILGFGLLASAYFQLNDVSTPNILTWASVELLAEGAMRCLFSILFGAGVVLFAGVREDGSSRAAGPYFRRNFLLLLFGLINAYLLLWTGDILFTYGVLAFFLYPARNASPRKLIIGAAIILVLFSALYAGTKYGLSQSRDIAQQLDSGALESTPQMEEFASGWRDFAADYYQPQDALDEELRLRSESYSTAFQWTAEQMTDIFLFVFPIYLFWDALAMMLLGMALFKSGVLSGQRSRSFYVKLTTIGFACGLGFNGYEVYGAVQSNYDIMSTFGYMQWTYHFGRLGMAMGYLGALILLCQSGAVQGLLERLAAAGRMALTNYLMHSLICMLIFTGAGLGLVGAFSRWQLYIFVFAIWAFQLWFSPWWLARYQFGPLEWLWRWLTYGVKPQLAR